MADLNPEALRPASEIARALTRIRGRDTFGLYAVSHMPGELSGRAPRAILSDSRMEYGGLIMEPIASSSAWNPDSRVNNPVHFVTASRRIVELCAALDDLNVSMGAFSYQLEVRNTGRQVFEDAVAPLANRILEGLRQPR